MFHSYDRYVDRGIIQGGYVQHGSKAKTDNNIPSEQSAGQSGSANEIDAYKQKVNTQKNNISTILTNLNNSRKNVPCPNYPDEKADKFKKEDGSLDEEKYKEAYSKYCNDMANYMRILQNIDNQIDAQKKEMETLDKILAQLESIEGTSIPEDIKEAAQKVAETKDENIIAEASSMSVNNMEVQSYITKFSAEKNALAKQSAAYLEDIGLLASVKEPEFKKYINSDGTIDVDRYKADVQAFNDAQAKILKISEELEILKTKDEWLESILSDLYSAKTVKEFKDVLINKPEPVVSNDGGSVDTNTGSIDEQIETAKKGIESLTSQRSGVLENLNNLNSQVTPLIDEFTSAFNNAPKLESFVKGDVPNVQAYNAAIEQYNTEQNERLDKIQKMLQKIAEYESVYKGMTKGLGELEEKLEKLVTEKLDQNKATISGLNGKQFQSIDEVEKLVDGLDVQVTEQSSEGDTTTYRVGSDLLGWVEVDVVKETEQSRATARSGAPDENESIKDFLDSLNGMTFKSSDIFASYVAEKLGPLDDGNYYLVGDIYSATVSYEYTPNEYWQAKVTFDPNLKTDYVKSGEQVQQNDENEELQTEVSETEETSEHNEEGNGDIDESESLALEEHYVEPEAERIATPEEQEAMQKLWNALETLFKDLKVLTFDSIEGLNDYIKQKGLSDEVTINSLGNNEYQLSYEDFDTHTITVRISEASTNNTPSVTELTTDGTGLLDPLSFTSLEELQAAISDKTVNLRNTFRSGVYCQSRNPDKPKGDYTEQKHYVWNNAKNRLEEIPGLYYIKPNGTDVYGGPIKNAALQSTLQGYNFTTTDGVFEKGGKYYKYVAETNSFEETELPKEPTNDELWQALETSLNNVGEFESVEALEQYIAGNYKGSDDIRITVDADGKYQVMNIDLGYSVDVKIKSTEEPAAEVESTEEAKTDGVSETTEQTFNNPGETHNFIDQVMKDLKDYFAEYYKEQTGQDNFESCWSNIQGTVHNELGTKTSLSKADVINAATNTLNGQVAKAREGAAPKIDINGELDTETKTFENPGQTHNFITDTLNDAKSSFKQDFEAQTGLDNFEAHWSQVLGAVHNELGNEISITQADVINAGKTAMAVEIEKAIADAKPKIDINGELDTETKTFENSGQTHPFIDKTLLDAKSSFEQYYKEQTRKDNFGSVWTNVLQAVHNELGQKDSLTQEEVVNAARTELDKLITNVKNEAADKITGYVTNIVNSVKGGNYQVLTGLKIFEKDGVELSVTRNSGQYVINVVYPDGNIDETINVDATDEATEFLTSNGFTVGTRAVFGARGMFGPEPKTAPDPDPEPAPSPSAPPVPDAKVNEIINEYYTGTGSVTDSSGFYWTTEGYIEVDFTVQNKNGTTSEFNLVVSQGNDTPYRYNEIITSNVNGVTQETRLSYKDKNQTEIENKTIVEINGDSERDIYIETRENNVLIITECEYGDSENWKEPTSKKVTKIDDSNCTTTEIYDAEERLTSYVVTDGQGKKIREIIYEYGEYVDTIKDILYDEHGNVISVKEEESTDMEGIYFEETDETDGDFDETEDGIDEFEEVREEQETPYKPELSTNNEDDNEPGEDKLEFLDWVKDKNFSSTLEASEAYEAYLKGTKNTSSPDDYQQVKDVYGNLIGYVRTYTDDDGNTVIESYNTNKRPISTTTIDKDGHQTVVIKDQVSWYDPVTGEECSGTHDDLADAFGYKSYEDYMKHIDEFVDWCDENGNFRHGTIEQYREYCNTHPAQVDSVAVDQNGNKIKTTWTDTNRVVTTERTDGTSSEEYTSPNGDKLIVEKNKDGHIMSRTEVKHLPGDIVETTTEYIDGEAKGQKTVTRDHGNGRTEKDVYNTDGKMAVQYDTTQAKDGTKTIVQYEYINGNKKEQPTCISKLDKNGNLTAQIEYTTDKDGNTVIYEYKYDGKGNTWEYKTVNGKQELVKVTDSNGQNITEKAKEEQAKEKEKEKERERSNTNSNDPHRGGHGGGYTGPNYNPNTASGNPNSNVVRDMGSAWVSDGFGGYRESFSQSDLYSFDPQGNMVQGGFDFGGGGGGGGGIRDSRVTHY